jgi:hypothetical protein
MPCHSVLEFEHRLLNLSLPPPLNDPTEISFLEPSYFVKRRKISKRRLNISEIDFPALVISLRVVAWRGGAPANFPKYHTSHLAVQSHNNSKMGVMEFNLRTIPSVSSSDKKNTQKE